LSVANSPASRPEIASSSRSASARAASQRSPISLWGAGSETGCGRLLAALRLCARPCLARARGPGRRAAAAAGRSAARGGGGAAAAEEGAQDAGKAVREGRA
jgi:hypothetical protein